MTTPSEAAKKWAEDWAIDHPAFAQAEVHNKYGYAGELGDYQDTAFKAGFDAGRAYERAEWEGEKEKFARYVQAVHDYDDASDPTEEQQHELCMAYNDLPYSMKARSPSWAREEKP